MTDNQKSLDIIQGRGLITCVASMFPNQRGRCLNFSTALGVVKESKTAALVYYIPDWNHDHDEYTWSFTDLLENMGESSEYAILANTSGASTMMDAIKITRRSVDYFHRLSNIIFHHQTEPIIKLEILNNNLKSVDIEVIKATEKLVSDYQLTVIPLVSPNINSIIACVNAGARLVRVLTGDIGQGTGLKQPESILEIVTQSPVPLIFEGGISTMDHVNEAFTLGATAVLVNSAFKNSNNPIGLAKNIRQTVEYYKNNIRESPQQINALVKTRTRNLLA